MQNDASASTDQSRVPETAQDTDGIDEYRCRACLQTIPAGATICCHCQSNQNPNIVWRQLSSTLKWIGGIVTTLSLFLAMVSLNQIYQDWTEKRETIAEIAASAQWLIRLGHYDQAWDMYQQAAVLNPSAKQVRTGQFNLAKLLVRNFRVDLKQADTVLRQVTNQLYRGLPGATQDQVATILAHIGWAQVLRKNLSLPVLVPVESLFSEALNISQNNAYANAMYAGWLLHQRPVEIELINRAEQHFNTALQNIVLKQEKDRKFIHRLQFNSLYNHSYGTSPAIEQAAMKAMVHASLNMMENNEPLPNKIIRQRIIDGYGRMGRAEHAEALMQALPPERHLAVYRWLLNDQQDTLTRMRVQSGFIVARLQELAGHQQAALARYRQLAAIEPKSEHVRQLIDQGIKRLTGSGSARAKPP